MPHSMRLIHLRRNSTGDADVQRVHLHTHERALHHLGDGLPEPLPASEVAVHADGGRNLTAAPDRGRGEVGGGGEQTSSESKLARKVGLKR